MIQSVQSAAAVFAGSLIAGVSIACALISSRRLEPLFALIGLAALATAATGVVTAYLSTTRVDLALLTVIFGLAAGGGGYALVSTSLHLLTSGPPHPTPRIHETRADSTAVIIVRCVEPSTYSPRSTAVMLERLAEVDLIQPSVAMLPILFFAQKARYRESGGISPAVTQLERFARRLSERSGDAYAYVSWATCGSEDGLLSRVATALERGCGSIVALHLSIAPSEPFERVASDADSLIRRSTGGRLTTIAALDQADSLIQMLTRRMSAARAGAEDTAALLISHGVPEQHAAGSQQFLACERSFANRVRMGLIEDGWEEGSVRIAWSQWLDPDVTSELRHLAALGYRRILVNAVTRPIDSLSSTTDIALAIRAAHIDSEVDIEILEPWGDDPMVIDALNAHVEDALRNQEP